ncbi:hypothetical protein QL285_002792 [Trifolium repens]|nr:hypothetical protein QL285_002792 [Trifolium repens]
MVLENLTWKATKDPSEPRPKKVSRKAYGQKKSRKPRKLILNETDEDREKAETEATLAKVAKLEAKEKEKEAALANSWESGVEPNKDAHIDSVLSPKAVAEILANQKMYKTLDNVTGDAPSDHLVQNDEDSEETPPQKNTPPHPSTSMVDQDTQTKVAIPEVDQTKPTSPPPSETDHTILSETINEPFEQQSQLEIVGKTLTLNLPTNQQFQDLSRTLDTDLVEQSPSHTSALDSFMDNLERECIPVEYNPKDFDNLI